MKGIRLKLPQTVFHLSIDMECLVLFSNLPGTFGLNLCMQLQAEMAFAAYGA
ncbi:MAG: hypothetical protein Q4E91_02880 [Lachnospiraceae bacterium]|nr:hypothetical protein [Lachnospiraceae bacterium]